MQCKFLAMEYLKKLTFSDPFLSHRRKVFSGFGLSLGIGASLLLCSLFFFINPFWVPKVQVFLPEFNTTSEDSLFASPPSSFNTSQFNYSSENNTSVTSFSQHYEGTVENVVEGRTGQVNVSGIRLGPDVDMNNVSFGLKVGGNVGNASCNGVEGRKEGSLVGEKNVTVIDNGSQVVEKMKVSFYEECDIFDGKWVRHDSKPYYRLGSCPFIDRDFDCHRNGRPDRDYVKWKWQPNQCDIPRYVY